MKYMMNKNVTHNGKFYAKDSEISASDDGCKSLVNAGHAVAVGSKAVEAPVESAPQAALESEEQSEASGKPARKSKR